MKMFTMVEIGERAGSGMDKIYESWKWGGYAEPSYEVAYGPDRTVLVLTLMESDTISDTLKNRNQNRQIIPEGTDSKKGGLR